MYILKTFETQVTEQICSLNMQLVEISGLKLHMNKTFHLPGLFYQVVVNFIKLYLVTRSCLDLISIQK